MQKACRPTPMQLGGVRCGFYALLEGDGRAQRHRPTSTFSKQMGWVLCNDLIGVHAASPLLKVLHFFEILESRILVRTG